MTVSSQPHPAVPSPPSPVGPPAAPARAIRRALTRLLLVLSLVLASAAGWSAPAHGFGTIDGLGQHREHEMITRAALACPAGQKSTGDCFEPKSIDQLAGKKGTFGAVGAPDIPIGGEVFDSAAHCDDADFLTGPYPRTRAQADAELRKCVSHLHGRFVEGVSNADDLLNNKDRIIKKEVDLKSDCTFAFHVPGRAKCDSLDGFGRALHGAQDFYAHSNWADQKSNAIDSVTNPPGLNQAGPTPLLDLRRTASLSAGEIPNQLSTGCFVLQDKTPGVGVCTGRVTHNTLNKDKGLINPRSTSSPGTTRGAIKSNFGKAVAGAIAETRRQWADQRAAILSKYGDKRGALMVCALTRDDPVKDCQGRKLGIVVDSSGSNQDTDPSNLRVSAAAAFNASLVTEDQAGPGQPADLSTVIDFDTSARVISPLADPSKASFAGIDSDGGTNIGSGVSAAIRELTRDPDEEPTENRTGIVVLTDGMDASPGALQAALAQAAGLGIRVSFGFLSPPTNPVPNAKRGSAAPAKQRDAAEAKSKLAALAAAVAPPIDLVQAILATGGFFATIDSAEAQANFIRLVTSRGPTAIDDANGDNDGGLLLPGVSVAASARTGDQPDEFFARTAARGAMTFTMQSLGTAPVKVQLRDLNSGTVVSTGTTDSTGRLVLTADPRKVPTPTLQVTTTSTTVVPYTVTFEAETCTITGTDKGERLVGTDGDDVICGGGGDDTLIGGEGDDILIGGDGRDQLQGGSGSDELSGGPGADQLYGGSGKDRLTGGSGDDRLYGESDKDYLSGGSGRDRIFGGSNDDEIHAGSGNDTVYGEHGKDKIWGNSGSDHLYGGSGADRIYGGSGNDWLYGESGADRLEGGSGNDHLYGGSGKDVVKGGSGRDRVKAQQAADAGVDELLGGTGDDVLYPVGDDRANGGPGADRRVDSTSR